MAEQSRGRPAAILAGRYQLDRLIARGGMSAVYEARDRELRRRVAVKVFRADVDSRERFRIEAVTLAALNHPGLVRVFDAGDHQGDAFVVLELVDGPTLARRVRDRGPSTPDEVAEIGARVADALAHVHSAGVVHRDVTPSNILCGSDGRPKLADFGIARLVDTARLTAPAMAVGTAAYMAPEQVLGEDVTPAADVYSLGLVLLEMLTGARAYDGPSREAAVARLVRPPRLPAELPRDWRRLIRGMTGLDPASRPSAREVRDRLLSMRGLHRPTVAPLAAVSATAIARGDAGASPEPATVAMSAVDGTALLPAVVLPGPVRDHPGAGRPRRVPALAALAVAAVGVAAAGLAGFRGDGTVRPPATTSVLASVGSVPVAVTVPDDLTVTTGTGQTAPVEHTAEAGPARGDVPAGAPEVPGTHDDAEGDRQVARKGKEKDKAPTRGSER